MIMKTEKKMSKRWMERRNSSGQLKAVLVLKARALSTIMWKTNDKLWKCDICKSIVRKNQVEGACNIRRKRAAFTAYGMREVPKDVLLQPYQKG